MTTYNRVGSSLSVFFFILLACPLVASLPATALGTIPPQASPAASNFDGEVTLKGDWSWKDRPEDLPLKFVSRNDGGSIVCQLIFSPTAREGMHNVNGKLMARNGKYLTDYDATMLVEGVYIEDLGRLMAIAKPLVAVDLANNSNTTSTMKNGKPSITSSGRNRQGDKADIVAQSAALRRTAEVLLGLTDSEAEAWLEQEKKEKEREGVENSNNNSSRAGSVDNSSILLDTGMGKNTSCQFSLELNFHRNLPTAEASEPGTFSSPPKNKVENSDFDKSSSLPLSPEELMGDLYNTITVSGQLSALRCGLGISITAAPADTKAYAAKATRYSIMMTFIALIQMVLTIWQLEVGADTLSRISLLSLGQQAVQDAFLCLMHLTLAILVDPLFTPFATTAGIQFCLFGIFELRMLFLAWKARRRGVVDPWQMHRELTTIYIRFYGAVVASLVLFYNFRSYMRVITLILHGFWIPQILRSCKTDTRPPLLPGYVIGMSMTRLVLPLYLFACPRNLLKVAPSTGMCVALVVLVGAQAVTVLLQSLSGPRFGPRWFIPRKFLPQKYDYYRPCPGRKGDIETGETEDCVICMNAIDSDESSVGATMIAPCDHRFHSRCLQRWLAIKMECPTCRRVLPPP